MSRFYLPPERWDIHQWELTGDEAKHCVKVLRLREGDSCVLFDGRGHAVTADISLINGSSLVQLVPTGEIPSTTESLARITLCQAIPKGSNMDWIVQKAVELGVSRIQPILTDRTISRFSGKEAESKQQKWQRTALEACKQCGQNLLPSIDPPITFKAWVQESLPSLPDLKLIASLTPGSIPIRECLESARHKGIADAAYLVGPEGDFTPEETQTALACGLSPVSLGPIVLRVETATLLGISMLRYALDQ